MSMESTSGTEADFPADLLQTQRKRKRPVISCKECHRRKQKCDRLQPCSNCIRREKTTLCSYDFAMTDDYNPTSHQSVSQELASQNQSPGSNMTIPPGIHQSMADHLGYSTSSKFSTLGIMQKVDSSISDQFALPTEWDDGKKDEFSLQYKRSIRQLPSKRYVDILVQLFFVDIAWQYDVINEEAFKGQLDAWNRVSYSMIGQGLFSLSMDVRCFPALLFQVLAQALLFQPLRNDSILEDLKYASQMTFHDLAAEYSEAGHAILTIMGKRDATLVKVQAGLVRASFQKSTGHVVEAWHTLSATIKDAQEIGLHCTPSPDHSPMPELEERRKMWLVLHLWDAHMGVVLGRPMSTKVDPDAFPLSGDLGQKRARTSPHEIVELDRPTPFIAILLGYQAAYKYLQDICDLEFAGAKLEHYCTVEKIHTSIVNNIRSLPSWARVESPNLEYDHLHSCYWLQAARENLITETYFVLLALHRPYIFCIPNSRNEALQAALQILSSQARLFSQAEPRQFMAFNLIFATFDAIVLTASIYILYPTENLEHIDASLCAIEWGIARFDTMRKHNKMAGLAYEAVSALYRKLRHRQTLQTPMPERESWGRLRTIGRHADQIPQDASSSIPSSEQIKTQSVIDLPATNTVPAPHPTQDLIYHNLFGPEISVTSPNFSGFQSTSAPSLHADAADGPYANNFWQFMDNLGP
ncbi:Oleate activated transcription factor 3 [Tolypocladium ophioglossoides CBS 100239]|uniref:Oleate activated transcription factor 3 n=1 Tax=Tolypocladium ophioglossoides (strain CBS 100239) TaxID=1163406 RepID=A0A0L0N4F2_TOLOC|nr:Oleate activated transcription factor 3 [Tolypocladium ophioglossoides CBS 100239]